MTVSHVSDAHVHALVQARTLCQFRGGRLDRAADNDLGRLLVRENMKSLASRYKDQPIDEVAIEAYRYMRPANEIPVVALIKAIHCYRYQACEHDGWEKSEAARYCLDLEQSLVSRLPGYEDAPWGIE